MSEDILAAIDAAVADYSVGPDAVRTGGPVLDQDPPVEWDGRGSSRFLAEHSHVHHGGICLKNRNGVPCGDMPAAVAFQRAAVEAARILGDFGRAITVVVVPAINRFGEQLARVARAVWEAVAPPPDPRARYGWQTNRAGEWISPICAAWVHEGCPLPELCSCRCDHPPLPALVP